MATTEKQGVKSRREETLDRLRSRHPDQEFADDESIFGRISDDYDDYDSQISGYKEREQAFADLFTSDPRSAQFVTNWRKGSDPVVELVRQFGSDIKEALDDPSRQEALAEANKEFVDRVSKERELKDTYERNLEESLVALDTFQQERGLTDDQIDAVMQFLIGIVGDGIMGKFSVESMSMALKAINHDIDVTQAEEDAEVRGKNAKIEEKLRRRSSGDGTASLSGKSNSARSQAQPSLGALDNYGDGNLNIWERGGEKRKKPVL